MASRKKRCVGRYSGGCSESGIRPGGFSRVYGRYPEPLVVETSRPADHFPPSRAPHPFPVGTVVANLARWSHGRPIGGVPLPFKTAQVLKPSLLVDRLWFACTADSFDKTPPGSIHGLLPAFGQTFEATSVLLEDFDLGFREDGPRASDQKRRCWHYWDGERIAKTPFAREGRRFWDAELERAGGGQDREEPCVSSWNIVLKVFTFVVRIGV